jgi:hypothetical protein
MPFHASLTEMLRESLPEYVAIARLSLATTKQGRSSASFHGYPAATLLFAVADAIGSYFQGSSDFLVSVDGKQRSIDGDGHKHFFIFNSTFYGQALSEREILSIYDSYRNPLIHNGAMKPGAWLNKGHATDPVFYCAPEESVECVNVTGLVLITDRAVTEFLKVAPEVVPGSRRASVMPKNPNDTWRSAKPPVPGTHTWHAYRLKMPWDPQGQAGSYWPIVISPCRARPRRPSKARSSTWRSTIQDLRGDCGTNFTRGPRTAEPALHIALQTNK